MRHRRLSHANGANEHGGHSEPRSTAPPASLTSNSALVTFVSAIFGFVLSTCTLLFIWYSYVDNTFDMGSTHQSQIDGVPHWEWHRYSDFIADNVTRIKAAAPRYLIVQIATAENLRITDVTSRVNRAYAKRWKVDHAKITLYDAASYEYDSIRLKDDTIDIIRDVMKIGRRHATAKKSATSTVLHYPYDMVWIFHDPSMMPVNFEKSIFENNDSLVTALAQHTSNNDEQNLIANDGALLWNLTHPYISKLLDSWERNDSLRDALLSISQSGVQMPLLNKILDDTNIIYHSPDESIGRTSEETNLDLHIKNMIKLQSVADLVCFRYFPACDVL
ncbi:hypothetical protein ACHAWO_007057 [Cyclotella atomus]|uniref:Uncharacterized protein n=1 Tax=Cyclotella atomus TaxID=382360 RepID=A0ABD3NWI1_9STRA